MDNKPLYEVLVYQTTGESFEFESTEYAAAQSENGMLVWYSTRGIYYLITANIAWVRAQPKETTEEMMKRLMPRAGFEVQKAASHENA